MSANILKTVCCSLATAFIVCANSAPAQEFDADELEQKVRRLVEELLDEEDQKELAELIEESMSKLREGLEGAGDELAETFEELQRDLERAGERFGEKFEKKVEQLMQDEDFNELRRSLEEGDVLPLIREFAARETFQVGLRLSNKQNADGKQVVSVAGVIAGSPAEKSGFKAGDIIRRVNQKEIESLAELLDIVRNSKGEELAFRVDRDGKKVDIQVTPRRVATVGGIDIDEIEKLLREFDGVGEIDEATLRRRLEGFFDPAQVTPESSPKFRIPDNVSVTVKKSGSKPAEITVSRDDEVWKITENEVDTLPEDLQPIVYQVLGKSPNSKVESEKKKQTDRPRDDEKNEGFSRRIDELQKQLNELKKQAK